jgi:hypothetical protein
MARAAIVAENIDNLRIDGVTVTWPQGPIPEDWKIGIKRENGSFDRLHRFDYRDAVPADFSVIWARNVRSGLVRLDGARGSTGKAKPADIERSSLKIAE